MSLKFGFICHDEIIISLPLNFEEAQTLHHNRRTHMAFRPCGFFLFGDLTFSYYFFLFSIISKQKKVYGHQCLKCRLRLSRRENLVPHSSHSYGFSPVWIRRWTFKWSFVPKHRKHISQLLLWFFIEKFRNEKSLNPNNIKSRLDQMRSTFNQCWLWITWFHSYSLIVT